MNFQNSVKLLVLGTHQLRLLELVNSERIYMGFSIFLDDIYLDYSHLLPKITAKLKDVAKNLYVIPAEYEKRFSI